MDCTDRHISQAKEEHHKKIVTELAKERCLEVVKLAVFFSLLVACEVYRHYDHFQHDWFARILTFNVKQYGYKLHILYWSGTYKSYWKEF